MPLPDLGHLRPGRPACPLRQPDLLAVVKRPRRIGIDTKGWQSIDFRHRNDVIAVGQELVAEEIAIALAKRIDQIFRRCLPKLSKPRLCFISLPLGRSDLRLDVVGINEAPPRTPSRIDLSNATNCFPCFGASSREMRLTGQALSSSKSLSVKSSSGGMACAMRALHRRPTLVHCPPSGLPAGTRGWLRSKPALTTRWSVRSLASTTAALSSQLMRRSSALTSHDALDSTRQSFREFQPLQEFSPDQEREDKSGFTREAPAPTDGRFVRGSHANLGDSKAQNKMPGARPGIMHSVNLCAALRSWAAAPWPRYRARAAPSCRGPRSARRRPKAAWS